MPTPTIDEKLAALGRIYDLYEGVASEYEFACGRKCATCCTRNVVLTSLEGYRMAEMLGRGERARFMEVLRSATETGGFRPKITFNEMADRCMRGEDLPPETVDMSAGGCPLLDSDECPFYDLRPFACRCMVSIRRCDIGDAAEMPPFLLTVNTVLMQYIEHVDADGFSGNLTDVMTFMASAENRRHYAEGRLPSLGPNLIPNRHASVLMIPPEHRDRMNGLLARLS